ncbi:hypothetical protein [Amycolatopsis sp. H20-H5]|uniref:hypothetical protein n=1 Tax=Amycolatopsis sp. H20-H5 TaxID=3046309 RepID=UPI002DB85D6B|nr:hypothetical protein [Amycolatopsis sp. H20-H5]MEC3979042.1 hypothetical protein [Amycolatopsis sp. H20-H5]
MERSRPAPLDRGPAGQAIAERFGVGKVKLRNVRDAYYTLPLGLPPFNADEPLPAPLPIITTPAKMG